MIAVDVGQIKTRPRKAKPTRLIKYKRIGLACVLYLFLHFHQISLVFLYNCSFNKIKYNYRLTRTQQTHYRVSREVHQGI